MSHLTRLFILCSHLALCVTASPPPRQCQNHTDALFQYPTCDSHTEEYRDTTWRSQPTCFPNTSRTYCSQTLSAYRGRHSLGIISTPEAARRVADASKQAAQITIAPPKNLYDVRDIHGKGKGVIAKRRIAKGDVIMLNAPAIVASARIPVYATPAQGAELFRTAVEMLDPATKKSVLSLDGGADAGIDGVVEKNAFSCRFEDAGAGDDYLCLFAEVSRINHACRPNSNAKLNQKTLLMEIRALRDILPGEEISISYGRVDLKYAERQSLYNNNWGFTCTCELCTAGMGAIAGSDERRERFAWLHEQLDLLTAETYDAQRVVSWENEIFSISEDEGFEVLITDDLERMAYVHAGLGHPSEALSFARRAQENILMWKVSTGETSDEHERVSELLDQLGAH